MRTHILKAAFGLSGRREANSTSTGVTCFSVIEDADVTPLTNYFKECNMSYYMTIFSSHGPVASAWEPNGPLFVYAGADEAPVASLADFRIEESDSSEVVWDKMLRATLMWLVDDSPGVEIHGYSVGRRQSISLERFLDAKKAS